MYKSIVILVADYKKEVDLEQLLEKICVYIGARLIENKELNEGAPIIPLTSTLLDSDKKAITELCGNYVTPIFLEYHEDQEELMQTYVTARIRV